MNNKFFRVAVLIITSAVISHLLFYMSYRFNFILIFILGYLFCIFLMKYIIGESKELTTILFIALFSVQLAHVVLKKTNLPFSNIGMYSWIETEKKHKNSSNNRNLHLKGGEQSTNSGLMVGELDDIESKIITRLLRNNDPKIDSLIILHYPGSSIK